MCDVDPQAQPWIRGVASVSNFSVTDPSSLPLSSAESVRAALARWIPRGAEVAILDVPVHRNIGDLFILAATRWLLAEMQCPVVYSAGAVGPAIFDPEIGMNFAMMVHGGQEFAWGEPVCSGDVITTVNQFKDYSEKDDGKTFFVFESVSTNQDGQEVCRATWTNIVRGG